MDGAGVFRVNRRNLIAARRGFFHLGQVGLGGKVGKGVGIGAREARDRRRDQDQRQGDPEQHT